MVVAVSPSERSAVTYDGGAVYELTVDGLFLQLKGHPFARGAIRVPRASIAKCSHTMLPSQRRTSLWLPDPGIELSLPDNDMHILEWCEEARIPTIERGVTLGTESGAVRTN
jgi:hypothetical protein